MRRTLLFTAALAAVLAVPATASAFRGVAIAKDGARHAVVIASKGGVVRTVRAPGRAGFVRLGHRVMFAARRLSDGTFRASTLHAVGNARHATIRGVVVRNQRRLHRLLLTAGGSVVAVRARGRGFASDRGPRAGDRVEVRVSISATGLTASSLDELGHENGLELEGIFLGISGGKLRLAVVHKGEVFVTVPDGFELPEFKPGDEIELVVSVDSAGAFTLVSVQGDDEDDDDHEGVDEDNGRVEVHGQITAVNADSITVQSHHASPVICAVPAGVDLSAFKLKDRVEMKCRMAGDKLVLTRLKKDDDEDDDDDDGDGGGHGGDD